MTKNKENSGKLGVLIIGCGEVSTQHIAAFQENPHTAIRALCGRARESCDKRAADANLKDVGIYTDYEEALKHPGVDIVSVCTPHHLHCEHVLAAAEAGKHIVIEKPAGNSLEELREMRQAVEKAGVKTIVSFVLRWNPLFETLKRLIADDAFGRVYYAETDYQHYLSTVWGSWKYGCRKDLGVSAFLVAGCHAVDALRWFAAPGIHEAARAVEVFAMSGGYRKGRTDELDAATGKMRRGVPPMEYDGLEVALVRFENGAIGKVSVNFDCIRPYGFPIEIFGDKGSVKDNKIWSHKFYGQTDWIEIPTICPDSGAVTHHPFQAQMDHFIDCILNDRESHCNLADAYHTHEIVFAIEECYKTGAPVRLPL
ncbi:MAG: Gfo/Idh/MocA family oxidoreductase [Candidatus Omnitrophota bacterium]